MKKETIIVNKYDNAESVRRKFAKLNPSKTVTRVKMLPVFASGLGRKAEVYFRRRRTK